MPYYFQCVDGIGLDELTVCFVHFRSCFILLSQSILLLFRTRKDLEPNASERFNYIINVLLFTNKIMLIEYWCGESKLVLVM